MSLLLDMSVIVFIVILIILIIVIIVDIIRVIKINIVPVLPEVDNLKLSPDGIVRIYEYFRDLSLIPEGIKLTEDYILQEISDIIQYCCKIKMEKIKPTKVKRRKKIKKESESQSINRIMAMFGPNPILASRKIANLLNQGHDRVSSLIKSMIEDNKISLVKETEEEIIVMRKGEDVL